jgi:hypothetical protein
MIASRSAISAPVMETPVFIASLKISYTILLGDVAGQHIADHLNVVLLTMVSSAFCS